MFETFLNDDEDDECAALVDDCEQIEELDEKFKFNRFHFSRDATS